MEPIDLSKPVQENLPSEQIIKVPSSSHSSSKTLKILILIFSISILLCLWVWSNYLGINQDNLIYKISAIFPSATPTQDPQAYEKFLADQPHCSDKGINLQQVNNVGYSFLLGQVDYPNTPPLGDNTKNDITQVMYKAKFPKKLLDSMAIVIVNTLAIKPKDYINTPYGIVDVPNFSPDFLTGGGIITYSVKPAYLCNFDNTQTKQGAITMIYINSKMLYSISDILTHELGHAVGFQLTDAEWSTFYKLRNISANTPRNNQVWNLSPEEDFAEVYDNVFTSSNIRTTYGPVNQQTKDFVLNIVNRLGP